MSVLLSLGFPVVLQCSLDLDFSSRLWPAYTEFPNASKLATCLHLFSLASNFDKLHVNWINANDCFSNQTLGAIDE